MGKGIGADDLHQLAELGGLLCPDLLCLVHEGLEFGIVVPRLARHPRLPMLVGAA